MNYYRTSDGEKIAKSTIDYRVRQAKAEKLEQFYAEHEYYFCEDCKKSTGVRIHCSHDLSVDQCQKQCKTELAYDVDNISLRCHGCHIIQDSKSRLK